jgi:hypothetical protein
MSSVETLLMVLAQAVVATGVALLNLGMGIALLIVFVPALAIGKVWASFVDKPETRPEQSIMVLVVPWLLMPALLIVVLVVASGIALSVICRALFLAH